MSKPATDSTTADPGCLRLLLIGDVHYYRLAVWPWLLAGKRLLGQVNLWLRRRRRFVRHLLAETVRRAIELEPDRVLMSGDLTTTALRGEFEAVARLLKPLIDRHPVVILPGNHDRYTFSAGARRGLERHFGPLVPETFPCRMSLNAGWELLAIDSAVPRMLSSRGRVGEAQLQQVARLLEQIPSERGVLVLCHYPILLPQGRRQKWGHRLADGAALLRVLLQSRHRMIYCHGHIHEPWLIPATAARPTDPSVDAQGELAAARHLTLLDAGAPCMVDARYPRGQGFWELILPPDPTAAVQYRHHAPADRPGEPWQVHPHADPAEKVSGTFSASGVGPDGP